MIVSTAQPDCPFLQRTQAWRGLACIENLDSVAAYRLTKLGGEGGNAGQALKKIERDPLSYEQ